MTTQDQQQLYLIEAKEKLNQTWDGMADMCGIHPRALKTYRMPPTSKDRRPLPGLAKAAIDRELEKL